MLKKWKRYKEYKKLLYQGLNDVQKKTLKKALNEAKKYSRSQMDVVGHFAELKKRFFTCIIITCIMSILPIMYSDKIIRYFISYGNAAGYTFIMQTAQEVVMSEISVGLRLGVVFSLPAWLYNIFAFFVPEKNRIYHIIIVHIIAFLFIIGVGFGIHILFPFMLQFFVTKANELEGVKSTVSIHEYTSFYLTVCTIFGILLEMPLVTVILSKCSLLTVERMRSARGVCLVIMSILAGIITPPDVASLIMVLVPMAALYEICIIITMIIQKRQKTAEG